MTNPLYQSLSSELTACRRWDAAPGEEWDERHSLRPKSPRLCEKNACRFSHLLTPGMDCEGDEGGVLLRWSWTRFSLLMRAGSMG